MTAKTPSSKTKNTRVEKVAGSESHLAYFDSGPKTAGTPVLLFVHGFPDNARLWKKQVEAFSPTHRCLCVDLPGYGEEPLRKTVPRTPRRGPDFHEIVELLQGTLQHADIPADQPVHLVGHDWGAVISYLFLQRFPARVATISCIDVGPTAGKQDSVGSTALVLGYHAGLSGAFFLQQIPLAGSLFGKVLSTAVLTLLSGLNEPRKLSGGVRSRPVSPDMCYVYFHFWKHVLQKTGEVRCETPQIPFFYAYGERGIKRFMTFHQKKWLKQLSKFPQAHFEAFDNCGHWLMRDDAPRYNASLARFLKSNQMVRTES